MNTDTRPTRWSSLTDAAAELGVSTRTVQRRIRAGTMTGRTIDGRTLVAMPSDATPGTVGAVVAGLQQQVETTDRMSTALLVVAERNIELMVARADRAERTARVRAVVAVAASLVAAAGLAWAVATTRQVSDTLTRLDAARAELDQQGQELATATRDRQLSLDAAAAARAERDLLVGERDLLVEELVALRACLSDNGDTVVAATAP